MTTYAGVDLDASFEHHGVKGQKWGVRKRIVLAKGTELHNISGEKARDASGIVFTAHTKKDILNYRAQFADWHRLNGHETFDNVFLTKTKITTPSDKEALSAFKKIYNKDPDGMLKALAESRKEVTLSGAVASKVFGSKLDSRAAKKLQSKGETYVQKKFEDRLATQAAAKVRDEYFAELTKRGFNAVLDVHDTRGSQGAEEPLIIFNGKKTLKTTDVIKLTKNDIDIAIKGYLHYKKP